MSSPETVLMRPQVSESFIDASRAGDPMGQVLYKLAIPAVPLAVMGVNSWVVGDLPGAVVTIGPALAQMGIYEGFYSLYKKLPSDKKEEVKRKADFVNQKIDAALTKGVRLTSDAASIALGFIFTSGGAGAYVEHLFKLDPLQAGAGLGLMLMGMFQIYEGGTGEMGRVITGQPRKYPFILDRFLKFYKELPKI